MLCPYRPPGGSCPYQHIDTRKKPGREKWEAAVAAMRPELAERARQLAD